jgi:hypothetical protein
MSESQVDVSHVEETVTQVLTQLVQNEYTFVCVEIKTKRETVALRTLKVQTMLVGEARFF